MYSDYEFLEVEPGTDRVLRITMNRPEKLNASGEIGHAEQGRIWREFDADPEMNVALITGAGRAFCAGGDIKEGNGPLPVDTRDGRTLVRSRVINAYVCHLESDAIRYRGALAFERAVNTGFVDCIAPEILSTSSPPES